MLVAGLAWWAVYELVRPQPRFRFLLPPGARIADARWLGSGCVLRIRTADSRADQLNIYDFNTNLFINPPQHFNKSHIEKLFDAKTVRSLGQYIIEQCSSSTFQVHNTADGTLVKHQFPESATLYLTEDGNTLFESTTLPLAPWAALSPAPFSAVPAALLMNCDAQRLCSYEIGFQLVQVRQLPSLAVIGRYVLPPNTQAYTLNFSANGKYLLHGFNQRGIDYVLTKSGRFSSPELTLPTPLAIPDTLRIWKTLSWMFPEDIGIIRRWTREVNLDANDKLQSKLWANNDLTGIWSDLGTDAAVYNASTGQKLYTTTFEKAGKPVQYRCISLEQDLAFISRGRADRCGHTR